ncbi:MAG: DUF1830 domain-containing protein [Synechococcales bacterium]|nr:DUF1830 domain-containing protein [Synechococcales bacterium]
MQCSYQNRSLSPQVLRIRNADGYFVTSIAYPGRRIFFSAPSDAFLEIQSNLLMTSYHLDYLDCEGLEVKRPKPAPQAALSPAC